MANHHCTPESHVVGAAELHIICTSFSMDMEDEGIFVCQPSLNSSSFTLDDFCLGASINDVHF